MRVVVHLSKSYDLVPVPAGIEPTKADIAAERVRPAANGGWNMKITKTGDTHLLVNITESDVIGKIIHEKCRAEGGRTLTRKQAVAFYIGENHLPLWAKKEWITKIEVHDDGPDEEMMKAMLAPHGVSEADRVAACKMDGNHDVKKLHPDAPERCACCGHIPAIDAPASEPNIPVADHAAHIAAYLEKAEAQDHVDHLHNHFKVKAVRK